MAEPYFTPLEKAQRAIKRRYDQMMTHLMQGDEKVGKRNFKDWKKQQAIAEFEQFKEQATREKEAEQRRFRQQRRLEAQRESAQQKILEARPLIEKIEKLVEALGWNYSMLLSLANSAYQEAPPSERPRVGRAILKDGSLENGLLVSLQKAGVPVAKHVADSIRGQQGISQVFDRGAKQITPKQEDQ